MSEHPFSSTMEAGLDATRRLLRRLQVPNRTVQRWTAEALIAADAHLQARIDRGVFTAARDDAGELEPLADAPCETEETA